MSAVFSHGRLRLYLLRLLADGPKHGYEVIRQMEEQFLGLYAPSAGTIYPRLQRMESDGLVTHTAVGGRKVYEITDAGRAELAMRAVELAALEREINMSVADLTTIAREIEEGVRGTARDMKRELRQASQDAARSGAGTPKSWSAPPPSASRSAAQGGPPWLAGNDPHPTGPAGEIEQRAAQLVAEVRRLTRTGRPDAERMRAALAVLEGAIDQVRRLVR